jgi:hypothetical protein
MEICELSSYKVLYLFSLLSNSTLINNLFYHEHKHHKMDVDFILITISEFCIILHV